MLRKTPSRSELQGRGCCSQSRGVTARQQYSWCPCRELLVSDYGLQPLLHCSSIKQAASICREFGEAWLAQNMRVPLQQARGVVGASQTSLHASALYYS